MQCRDARELLDSFLAQELLVETNHELLRHISGCRDCKADLDTRAVLRSSLKQAFARSAELQVRPEFVDEMTMRLRSDALKSGRAWPWPLLAAAAAVILVVAAGAFVLQMRTPDLAALAAGDHQNCAVKFGLAERPISLDEAAARYDSAYSRLRTRPPDEVRTGVGTLHVADRHSCVFENRRFAHVVFRLDQHLVSVLMTRDDSARAAGLEQLPPVNGLSIASVRAADHVVFVVSDLQEPAFHDVARTLLESRIAAIRGGVAASR